MFASSRTISMVPTFVQCHLTLGGGFHTFLPFSEHNVFTYFRHKTIYKSTSLHTLLSLCF